jgi:hypothetical protein
MMELPDDKRPAIMEAIYAGASRKIEAIKLVREATGCGLKEAKDYVEKTAAELYAKEPQKFSAPPGGKGCLGVVMAGVTVLVGAMVATKFLF